MIRIFGYSDDLLEIDGKFIGENEYGAYDKPVTIAVRDPDNKTVVFVTGEYGRSEGGVWSIMVSQEDEDIPLPNMRIENHKSGYSPSLIIECSEKSTVELVKESEEEDE
jgi:hypothetical protein